MRSAKRIWLFTYGAASPSITEKSLRSLGHIVKECYTLSQRDLKYTLVRMAKRVHDAAIVKLQESLDIIPQTLPGFDSVTSIDENNGGLDEHPGFRLIIEHMNNESSLLEAWMQDGDIRSNHHGILWQHRTDQDFSRMRKTKLVSIAKEVTANYNDLQSKYCALEERCDLLALEKAECEQDLAEMKERNSALKSRNRILQAFSDSESRRRLCDL